MSARVFGLFKARTTRQQKNYCTILLKKTKDMEETARLSISLGLGDELAHNMLSVLADMQSVLVGHLSNNHKVVGIDRLGLLEIGRWINRHHREVVRARDLARRSLGLDARPDVNHRIAD